MKKEININKIAEKSVCLEWFEMEGDLLAVTSEGVCKISNSSYLNKTCSVVSIDTVRVTKTDYYTSFEGHVIVENGEKCDKWFNLDAMHKEDVLTLCYRLNFN